MTRTAYQSISLPKDDIAAMETAIVRAREMGLVSYSSIPEFIRDSIRRRIEEVHLAWRQEKTLRKQ
jgi:hypothetical protein